MEKYLDVTLHPGGGGTIRFRSPPPGSSDEEKREWEDRAVAHLLSGEVSREVYEHFTSSS